MDNPYDFLKGRREPGVIMIDMNGTVLYMNGRTLELFPGLSAADQDALPEEVRALYERIRAGAAGEAPAGQNNFTVIESCAGQTCSVRGILVGKGAGHPSPTHIMMLIEHIAVSHSVDIGKAREKFGVTKREAEVLKYICEGLSNKEIAEKLFISEHTTKDHIKNILKKMGTKSRSGIIALLR